MRIITSCVQNQFPRFCDNEDIKFDSHPYNTRYNQLEYLKRQVFLVGIMKHMTYSEQVRKNLSEIIKQSGKTATQIAKDVGLSQPYVSNIQNGNRFPDVFMLRAFCRALDCTYEDILGEVE